MAFNPNIIHQPTFDGLKQLMGDKFPLILREYLRVAEGFVSQIQEANANSNMEVLADAAHPLKSSSAQIGAVAVRDIAEHIEKTARTGGDASQFPAMVKQLDGTFSELKVALSSYIENQQ